MCSSALLRCSMSKSELAKSEVDQQSSNPVMRHWRFKSKRHLNHIVHTSTGVQEAPIYFSEARSEMIATLDLSSLAIS